MTHENARFSCLQTVEDLQCEYLDLLLIHWPGKAKLQPNDPKHTVYRKEVWLSLEQLQKEGGYIFLRYFKMICSRCDSFRSIAKDGISFDKINVKKNFFYLILASVSGAA